MNSKKIDFIKLQYNARLQNTIFDVFGVYEDKHVDLYFNLSQIFLYFLACKTVLITFRSIK